MSGDLPEFDLEGYLPYRLAVAAERLSAALARQYRRRFGISVPEWRVLVNVAYAGDGPVSVRDVERRAGLEKSKVSRAATRLAAAGYLTKSVDEADRRLLKLALTPAGRRLAAEIVPLAQAFQAGLAARLGGDFAALQAALDRLMAAGD